MPEQHHCSDYSLQWFHNLLVTWQPQLPDDAGDGTWQHAQHFILTIQTLNQSTTAAPTCVNMCSIRAAVYSR